jgi:hypothetical protein
VSPRWSRSFGLIIMFRTARGDQVYWFGGFRPSRGIAIGIDFEAGRSAPAWPAWPRSW